MTLRLVGQSLELWRGMLRDAVERRDPVPLLTRATRQIERGADALDLNVGVQGDSAALVWAATTIREAHPQLELWLDCADADALARTLPEVAPPLVANAAFLGDPGAEAVIEAAQRVRARLVFSPTLLDGEAASLPATQVIDAAIEASRAINDVYSLSNAIHADTYVDCLAYPPASDATRTLRSLESLRQLRQRETALGGLVAVGNVGHGAPSELRLLLRGVYAAAATGAGAIALILPVEEPLLRDAIAVAGGTREPRDAVEQWLCEIAAAAADGAALPAPPEATRNVEPRTVEVLALLTGG